MRAFCLCAPRVGAPFVFSFSLVVGLSSLMLLSSACADEPNDTFAQATVLPSGTSSVTDDLFPGTGAAPNTFLGVFDEVGFDPDDNLLADDDDSSTLGNGEASGLTAIDVNPDGSIRFVVTGSGDFFFESIHEETGGYKAFVEVFDAVGTPIDDFSVSGMLQPDMADQHAFSNASWLGGNYAINLDNTFDGFSGGDVDFFTYTGLNPGAMFSAETNSIGSIDTILGWYNDAGTLLATDDDSGTGVWSLLAGTVPASGQLTFAVTGSGDDQFVGEHGQQELYNLQLTIAGSGFAADFDGDDDVDTDDLTHPTLGWQARYGNGLDGADFLAWQREFGSSGASGLASSQAVPEPPSCLLMLIAMQCCHRCRQNRA